MINVLVVDDSAFIRRSLTMLLEKSPDIKVVATAANGEEGVAMAKKHDPDVITMDVEMPRMSGLEALQRIMNEVPCPVIMISSLTSDGADTTLKAMEIGALDFIAKPGSSTLPDLEKLGIDLCAKVTALARRKSFLRLLHQRKLKEGRLPPAQTGTSRPEASPRVSGKLTSAGLTASVAEAAKAAAARAGAVVTKPLPQIRGRSPFDAVVIGVSTGGPPAVQKLLTALPAEFPTPILIAQHMPAAFTGPFAKRLDAQCAITVKECEDLERLRPGTAYVCPGGRHLRLENRGGILTGVVTDEPKTALYKPSANVLMETAGTALGRRALAVMLTGMGNDGLEGTKILREKGGHAIAQSESSCVVYGMPKAIVDANLANEIADLDDMAATILAHFSRG